MDNTTTVRNEKYTERMARAKKSNRERPTNEIQEINLTDVEIGNNATPSSRGPQSLCEHIICVMFKVVGIKCTFVDS